MKYSRGEKKFQLYLNTWAMTWPIDYRVSNPGQNPDSESESLTGADDLANSQDPDSESETQAGADDPSNSLQESCSEINSSTSGCTGKIHTYT